jgi:hypothetical protein
MVKFKNTKLVVDLIYKAFSIKTEKNCSLQKVKYKILLLNIFNNLDKNSNFYNWLILIKDRRKINK